MSKVKKGNGMQVLVVFALAAALFAGCSSKNEPSASIAPSTGSETAAPASSEATAAVSEAPTAAPVDVSPVTFTVSTADNKLVWETPITKALTEKTGVTLKYDLTVGDEKQKWDLWLAGGDYPDVVPLDPDHVQKYKDAGAIIPLNDLIEKYGPHIKEKFGNYYNLLKSEDGNIYSLYGVYRNTEAPADATPNWIVQYDVLKEAGYPVIKTLDQLYTVIESYQKNHPKIDGKDTIGFSGAMKGWTLNIEFNNPITFGAGLQDHGNFTIAADGKVSFNPVSDNAKFYYQFLNKLYNNGLLDKEIFSMDSGNMVSKMSQGRVLAAFAPAWLYGDAEKAIRVAGKPERAYAKLPIYLNDSVVDHNNTSVPTGAGTGQWVITKNTKHPERIIQFIDYLFSDEGQILTQWGIEGKDYTVVDGKRTETPEKMASMAADPDFPYKEGFKSENTSSTGNWFGVGSGSKLADGDYATPVTKASVVANYDAATKEILGKYGKEVWADFLPPVEKVPGYLWQLTAPDSTKVPLQKINDEWAKDLPKIIMSKNSGEFDDGWKKMQDAMVKHGMEGLNSDMTKLWADFIANYNKTIGQ
ncbi:unnamed protein product [Aphanomyces euteiches]